MTKYFKSILTGTALCAGTATAQTPAAGFDNFLLRSPSIVSPSQHYQVPRGRFEADLGVINGDVDAKAPGASDGSVNGLEAAVGGFYSPDPVAVIGLTVDYRNTEANSLDATSTEITPSVAFIPGPSWSLGLSAHLVSGSEDQAGGGNSDTDFNYFTAGATLHEGLWEGTLVFSSENKDDNKPQNNSPQSFGIHGRYRIVPAMALGLSFFQKDTSGLAAGTNAKDETAFGLHLESTFTDLITGEFAFISTADTDGASGNDESEFLALGQYRVTPTIKVGGRLSYLTSSNSTADSTGTKLGVFLTSDF
jgi:hypothetical protein